MQHCTEQWDCSRFHIVVNANSGNTRLFKRQAVSQQKGPLSGGPSLYPGIWYTKNETIQRWVLNSSISLNCMKKIEVRESKIEGKGVFALEPIRKGERIQYIRGPRFKRVIKGEDEAMSLMNSIGIGRYSWVDTEGTPFRYINHSCEPNAAIVTAKTVVAMKNIRKGEEITIDYSMTDADPFWQMTCVCGTKTCRKRIASIQGVPPHVFKRHMPFIPKNFQRIYLKEYVRSQLGIQQPSTTAKRASTGR